MPYFVLFLSDNQTSVFSRLVFVKPTYGEREIVVTTSGLCMCVLHACVCLDLSGPKLVHLCMDFKIIWHSCSPCGIEVPFEKFVQVS